MAHPLAFLRLALLLALAAGTTQGQPASSLARRRAIEDAMHRANAYYQANFALGTAVWNRGAYHGGNLRAWQTLGLAPDLAYSIRWAEANSWTVGPEAGGGADADSQTCGQAYLDLYELDPQPVRKASIKSRIDLLVANPAASTDDWWWIDAFYMAAPTFARLARIENDPVYLDRMLAMYRHMRDTRALFDPAHGLWYRDAAAKGRTGANTPQFWGRGNGWIIAGCARVLEQLPAGDPRRADFEAMLQTMAAALLPLQDADGFWRANLLFPAQYPAPETSCTAFFTYAIAYGINAGLLDPAVYTPVVDRAWEAMVATALNSAGRLGYVQAIGVAPAPATPDGSQDYGYGAFLLAGRELLEMLGGPAPVSVVAGPAQTRVDTDVDYAEPVRLDASATVLRDESPARFTWWLGSIFLGEGKILDVEFPLGDHAVTLAVEHGDEAPFLDQALVRVRPAPSLDLTVSAIGHQIPNTPQNVLDGDLGTRWSQEGDGQWIAFRLPLDAALDHVDIAFYLGDARRTLFDLQVSLDGLAWETVYSGSSGGQSTGLERFAFPARVARHVRFLGHGNTLSAWNSVTEFVLPLPAILDSADTDANGLPDAWEIHHFGATGQGPFLRPTYIAGIAPDSAATVSVLRIRSGMTPGEGELLLSPRPAFGPGYLGKVRYYRLVRSPDLRAGAWQTVPSYESIPGYGEEIVIPFKKPTAAAFFRAEIWLE